MRVAMIGLGDIARKAYLPVLGTRADVQLAFVTRSTATLDELGAAWRVDRLHTDLDEALAQGLDVAFVHAATEVHPAIVRRLIEAGVPTLVDKPIADTLDEAEAVVDLAETRGVSLAVGFNRRHAPAQVEAAALKAPFVLMQKNRTGHADGVRRTVFDDFIHVIDSLRFLAPGATEARISGRRDGDLLEHVMLHLTGPGLDAVGIMNRTSGANEEVLEVMGGGIKRRVVNLSDVTDFAGGEHLVRRGDWTSVGRQRGFEAMIDAFLSAVREDRRLSTLDALETHRLCEQVVAELTP
ncbi:Gfo/Idh/MocA family oxidoreductase [Caulobacter sp. 602-2]|uniref:Gfo/Idh/MocA family oxidoreductase n=1 Tax=Caulobacter sp. 602-2 TaxID=2710887 RepID=A0A6G4QTN1_9CAUL|nr:Gfo/Idh/MocA family oxidoreductase [Caulobacter sp. 602-2]NGM48615.1 Gfo/Idh/MocA family oxidoreductase [Caulobacter sp. 602-2]